MNSPHFGSMTKLKKWLFGLAVAGIVSTLVGISPPVQRLYKKSRAEKLLAEAARQGIPVYRIEEELLTKIKELTHYAIWHYEWKEQKR